MFFPLGNISTGEGCINSHSYKRAGVDIGLGNALIDAIKPLAEGTARAGAAARLGGFGGLFDLKAAGFNDAVLVAGADGVGTKLILAQSIDRHRSVGIDLVAMCANDVVVQGAEPLFFLDYFATGRLDPRTAEEVIGGIAAGCLEAGCALIGGETAELPGMYEEGRYDLAGFCVGAVERDKLLDRRQVREGDVLLGLAASGPHANGYSLIRAIVADHGLAWNEAAPFAPDRSLGEALITPTRIYVKSCLGALAGGKVRALCHITGGGLIDNLPRVLPDGLAADIDAGRWPLPPVFAWLAETGGIAPMELARIFNCGLGMVAIVAPGGAAASAFSQAGETVFEVGAVVARAPGEPAVRLHGAENAWPA
ncbi:MAG: phosphoribosylformylglycinamidine cyclo-ligase [Alphaproteobacteria bacterium]